MYFRHNTGVARSFHAVVSEKEHSSRSRLCRTRTGSDVAQDDKSEKHAGGNAARAVIGGGPRENPVYADFFRSAAALIVTLFCTPPGQALFTLYGMICPTPNWPT
jgi:hypothetical protein